MGPFTFVGVTFRGPVASVTLRRADRKNALNQQLIAELTAAFTALVALPVTASPASSRLASAAPDPGSELPRAVVLDAVGDKVWSAGVDIAELAQMSSAEAKRCADAGHALAALIESAPFPVIAAVQGYALGGGFELALACDFIYAAEGAKFGLPEVGLGVIPGFGGTQRLAHRIGVGRAREMIYTGQTVDAARALAMGLVNEVVPAADLAARVGAVADLIASKGPLAIAQAKRVMLRGVIPELSAALELEAQAFGSLFGSDDQREGTKAFLEKRAARFTGK